MLNIFTQDLGIDLGTATTLVYSKEGGVLLNEPSVIAVDTRTERIIATGDSAKDMAGRTPESIRVVRPLQHGVISDFAMTQLMIREYVSRVFQQKRFFNHLRVVVGIPSGVTEVEKRAVEEVIRQMGAKEVFVIAEPLAAALGVGLDIEATKGSMIADIGGGTTDIAVLSLGDIVTSSSIRYAGDKMDEAIVNYMRKTYNLLIGITMAEALKKQIGCVVPLPAQYESLSMKASGRDIISGLPKTVMVHPSDIMRALEESVRTIMDGIRATLENAPPELSADIVDSGLVLSGGGALLRGLGRVIQKETGMKVIVAENAVTAVAEGTGKSLDNMESLHRYAKSSKKY